MSFSFSPRTTLGKRVQFSIAVTSFQVSAWTTRGGVLLFTLYCTPEHTSFRHLVYVAYISICGKLHFKIPILQCIKKKKHIYIYNNNLLFYTLLSYYFHRKPRKARSNQIYFS